MGDCRVCPQGLKRPSKDRIAKHYNVTRYDCMACGMKNVVVDGAHILPLQYGGTNTIDNFHLLCRHCHYESEHLIGKEYEMWFKLKTELYDYGSFVGLMCNDSINRFVILDRIIRLGKMGWDKDDAFAYEINITIPEEDELSHILPFNMWTSLNGDLYDN